MSKIKPFIHMELSADEQKIILERRAKEAHEKNEAEFQIKALKVANDYVQWSIDRGYEYPHMGSFINSFGYDEDDRKAMCEAVQKIWKLMFSLKLPKGDFPC
ncbi:TPA: hypothetical protein MW296_000129 [Acinetobacter baumannii]|nr:hypothetical protein [Acinetobacter baumannii]